MSTIQKLLPFRMSTGMMHAPNNRAIGEAPSSGSVVLGVSGNSGILLSKSGNEVTCRWNIAGGASHTAANNGNNFNIRVTKHFDTFFTLPLSWQLPDKGYRRARRDACKDGFLNIRSNAIRGRIIFYRNGTGSCCMPAGSATFAASIMVYGIRPGFPCHRQRYRRNRLQPYDIYFQYQDSLITVPCKRNPFL